ncbi:hypothetical protein ACOSP7_015429 [Xanthoceras sorbifolium]
MLASISIRYHFYLISSLKLVLEIGARNALFKVLGILQLNEKKLQISYRSQMGDLYRFFLCMCTIKCLLPPR